MHDAMWLRAGRTTALRPGEREAVMTTVRLSAWLRAAAAERQQPPVRSGRATGAAVYPVRTGPARSMAPLHRTVTRPEPSPDAAADFELVRAFLARDAEATRRMGVRLQVVPRFLAGLCRRFGLPLAFDEIHDVGHDAIVIAMRKMHQLTPSVPLDAWLHRLCSYELSNALRRRRRRALGSLPDDVADPAGGAIEQLEQREVALLALDSLRPDEAEVVRLHLFEGLTFPEIAQRLGESLNTVKGRFYRSIDLLGVKLRRYRPTRTDP